MFKMSGAKCIVAVLFVVLFAATTVHAQEEPEVIVGGSQSTGVDPTNNLVQDPVDDACGPIDPLHPCYPAGGGSSQYEVCVKATSYETCMSKCRCEFRNSSKKCGVNPVCKDIAASERNACFGNCLVDFA
jgi:hypothetical protein